MLGSLLQSLVVTLSVAQAIGAGQAHASPHGNVPRFTITEARANRLSDLTQIRDVSTKSALSTRGLRVMRSTSGSEAMVDESLLHRGFLVASGSNFVDLSWDPLSSSTAYVVVRDGQRIANLTAGMSAYRDATVAEGFAYRYNIVPAIAPDNLDPKAEMWSLQVHVPRENGSSLSAQAEALAIRAASVADTTTLTWVTFIPEARVDAPTVAGQALCDYGSGYEFGGDNHGFDWKASSYRTAANAVITWSSMAVAGYTDIGTTHVYEKSTGKLVAEKTASGSGMVVMKIGSGSNWVELHMATHATNPFCSAGAIDGAFSMMLTQSGSYSIFSGNHRLMPNHYIYIYDGGSVTNVYERKYENVMCLMGPILCDLASLVGVAGNFD